MDKHLTTLIEQLEIELLQPDVRKSTSRLKELLAEDFFEFGSSGQRYSRSDILNMVPKLESFSYDIADFRITEISAHAVLATYQLHVGTTAGNESAKSLRSSVWQNINGSWRMVFHQGTGQRT